MAEERLSEDDRASHLAELFVASALALHQKATAGARPALTGRCHNCGQPGVPGLYCDDDCRADHQRREQRASSQGRRSGARSA